MKSRFNFFIILSFTFMQFTSPLQAAIDCPFEIKKTEDQQETEEEASAIGGRIEDAKKALDEALKKATPEQLNKCTPEARRKLQSELPELLGPSSEDFSQMADTLEKLKKAWDDKWNDTCQGDTFSAKASKRYEEALKAASQGTDVGIPFSNICDAHNFNNSYERFHPGGGGPSTADLTTDRRQKERELGIAQSTLQRLEEELILLQVELDHASDEDEHAKMQSVEAKEREILNAMRAVTSLEREIRGMNSQINEPRIASGEYSQQACLQDRYLEVLNMNAEKCASESKDVNGGSVQTEEERASHERRGRAFDSGIAAVRAAGPEVEKWAKLGSDPQLVQCFSELGALGQFRAVSHSVAEIAGPALTAYGTPTSMGIGAAVQATDILIGAANAYVNQDAEADIRRMEANELSEGAQRAFDRTMDETINDKFFETACTFYKMDNLANNCSAKKNEQDKRELFYRIACNARALERERARPIYALSDFFDNFDDLVTHQGVRASEAANAAQLTPEQLADTLEVKQAEVDRLQAEFEGATQERREELIGALNRAEGELNSLRVINGSGVDQSRLNEDYFAPYHDMLTANLPFTDSETWPEGTDLAHPPVSSVQSFFSNALNTIQSAGNGKNPFPRGSWKREAFEKAITKSPNGERGQDLKSRLGTERIRRLQQFMDSYNAVNTNNERRDAAYGTNGEAAAESDYVAALSEFRHNAQSLQPEDLQLFREYAFLMQKVSAYKDDPTPEERAAYEAETQVSTSSGFPDIGGQSNIKRLAQVEIENETSRQYARALENAVQSDLDRYQEIEDRELGSDEAVAGAFLAADFEDMQNNFKRLGITSGLKRHISGLFNEAKTHVARNHGDRQEIVNGTLIPLARYCTSLQGLWFGRDLVDGDGLSSTDRQSWDNTCGKLACTDPSQGLPDFMQRFELSKMVRPPPPPEGPGHKSKNWHFTNQRCLIMEQQEVFVQNLVNNFMNDGTVCGKPITEVFGVN